MKKNFFLFIPVMILCTHVSFAQNKNASHPEIYCKHFIHGYPVGTPASNDLIIRDIYALSSNDSTKFADWVAFRLDKETITGDITTTRNWKRDPWLDPDETMEPADYRGAYNTLKVDRGHQAPLASFKGTKTWHETNYLSNITPQKSALNRGPWKWLETLTRRLTQKYSTVYVMTGPLYTRKMPPLPGTHKKHNIPSGYWCIIIVPEKSKDKELQHASFIFDQETPSSDTVLKNLSDIDTIEKKTGLDFLWLLKDEDEEKIEKDKNERWAEKYFTYKQSNK